MEFFKRIFAKKKDQEVIKIEENNEKKYSVAKIVDVKAVSIKKRKVEII